MRVDDDYEGLGFPPELMADIEEVRRDRLRFPLTVIEEPEWIDYVPTTHRMIVASNLSNDDSYLYLDEDNSAFDEDAWDIPLN